MSENDEDQILSLTDRLKELEIQGKAQFIFSIWISNLIVGNVKYQNTIIEQETIMKQMVEELRRVETTLF